MTEKEFQIEKQLQAIKAAQPYWDKPLMGHGSTHEGNIIQDAFHAGADWAKLFLEKSESNHKDIDE